MKNDGLIELDTKFAKEIGFTSDLFEGYLWKKNNEIWISLIFSRDERKGNLTRLFNRIHDLGFTIKVPIPLGEMRSILKKKGFTPIIERNEDHNENINVWVKGP